MTKHARVTVLAVVVVLLTGSALARQTARPPQPLAPLDPFIGRWQGTSEGQPGKGTQQREYSRVLQSRFVEGRTKAVYPPQEKNPKGEQHEDLGIFSYDRARKTIVFRQFHAEGFMNQYVMKPIDTPGTLVFESEAIENIPPGYRARETYTFIGADEFEEVFELAEPGKDFSIYSRARLKRVQ
jgi:hypothetical protein